MKFTVSENQKVISRHVKKCEMPDGEMTEIMELVDKDLNNTITKIILMPKM